MFSRGAPALCAALLTCALAAPARGSVSVPLRPGEPPLPADLVALAKEMESVRVSSERFRVRTATAAVGGHVPRAEQELFKLFAFDVSGEVALSPPAGSFSLTLFGQTLRVRVVDGTSYLFEPELARRDGGRPWLDTGQGGLSGLLGPASGLGLPASPPATPFKGLATLLTGARSVTELGAGTLDGLAITGFRATVAASALEEPQPPSKPPSILRGIFSRARRRPPPAPRVPAPPTSAQVEVFIAPTGVPVRTHISETAEGVSMSALADVFAVNFPVRVARPPRRQTITLAALSALGKPRSARGRERED
ncbi:MAG TPA: hypothetical protein VNZ05_01050 [Solirubrobacteraceae bacterium]|nr:hypothetical protein [Solirubrobacteraceae bacterium]